MTLQRRQFLQGTAAAAATFALPSLATAYPARPVRVIVPFAVGGPNDILARIVAEKLSARMDKQFYVENVGGAGGSIGMGQGTKAPADGHTILVVPPNLIVNPVLYASVPYDPFRDFDPVTLAVSAKIVLAVHPSVAAGTVSELVALIKSSPSKFSFASPGVGTPPHLVGEQFRLSLGLDLAHVPFSGGAPAVTSTLGGHTPILFCSLPPVIEHIKRGGLRTLAVTSRTRAQALPDAPSMSDAGYPEIEGEGWFAFIVPSGTPAPVKVTLHREIAAILALPDVATRTAALGFEPVASTPEVCAAFFRSESEKWTRVIRTAGITAAN
ncbi:twin-arginine translocation signal domain-containing protein [Bradyrhizobium sp. SRL28]|nr:twin-arginine translocation signal domain-containing protein [Bradyrhizobium sp. SRL28]